MAAATKKFAMLDFWRIRPLPFQVGLANVLKRRKIRAYSGFCILSLHFASWR